MLLFKERLPLMHKALDTYTMRITAIAENIANANTVGYSPKKVVFEDFFKENINQVKKFVEKENQVFLQPENEIFDPIVVEDQVPIGERFFSGQSNVNIDKEMAQLAETQIRFRFVSRLLKRYFSGLNTAITGIREA